MPAPTPHLDRELLPWWRAAEAAAGGDLPVFDTHTHIGSNDPDGFTSTPEELLAALDVTGARGLVFPMHEPDGYPAANDFVIEAAAATNGRLRALCRIDPAAAGAVDEARRCLAAGARGIKLHPRAENFTLDHPVVAELVALVAAERLPLLVHAGRGIPALGRHAVALAREFPDAPIILAHAGISDLAWIWRDAAELPNLCFDTSWWSVADLLTVMTLVPPGQVLYASDLPYGQSAQATTAAVRCALQAGHPPEVVREIAGGQIARILDGEPPRSLGPAIGAGSLRDDPLLARIDTFLIAAFGVILGGGDPSEQIALARLACEVPDDVPEAPHARSIMRLIDLFDAYVDTDEPEARFPRRMAFLMVATILARTPDVAVPS